MIGVALDYGALGASESMMLVAATAERRSRSAERKQRLKPLARRPTKRFDASLVSASRRVPGHLACPAEPDAAHVGRDWMAHVLILITLYSAHSEITSIEFNTLV